MNQQHAIKIAIECIRKEIQRIAFDANMIQFGPSVSPGVKRAAERKKKLEQAIEALETEITSVLR